MKFSWDAAPAWVTRGMLEQAYLSKGQDEDASRLRGLTKGQLAAQARRTLGEPPRPRFFDPANREMCDWLLHRWLPEADDSVVLDLTQMVQAGLGAPARERTFRSTNGRVRFLQDRNRTTNLMANIRRAFHASYRVDSIPRAPSSGRGTRASWIPLVGTGSSSRAPYDHQLRAWRSLGDAAVPIRGVLVLPTGSGKTDTVAIWLLDRMQQDPNVRVLWIAHQQELVDQALRRFQNLAHSLPPDFERRARSIHSAGSASSTLGDRALDLAGITVQSLSRLLDSSPPTVDAFLDRPTYVVVDEAHHVGSDSYATVVDHLETQPNCLGIIGLTATPYPTSARAASRFHATFPATLIEVSREVLTAKGILARPRLHNIDTGTRVVLSGTERDQAIATDLPPAALRRLQQTDRDALLVRTWQRDRQTWGKTLVFATSIDHADGLRELFEKADVPCRSLHSRSAESSAETLDWFRAETNPCVLMSVGMLTEGVDLPDARTAFLARPTTSRILMHQMVGRVLRGPTAGGDPEAHLVYLRDRWENFGDVLEPPEVIPMDPPEPTGGRTDGALPPVVSDDGTPLPPEVSATVERLMAQARHSAVLDDDDPDNDRSLDPHLTASALAGYYDLGDRKVPVFEHQRDGYNDLLDWADEPLQGYGLLTFFDGEPPPFPTRRSLRELVEYAREFERPQFVELQATIGPDAAADAVIAAGPITLEERRRLVRDHFDSTLNRQAWATFAHFEQAVDALIRQRLDGARPFDAERLRYASTGTERLPRRRRPLSPIVNEALKKARQLLPPELADRMTNPPPVYWTRRVVTSTWGHWTIALGKKGAGRQQIRINRLLRTDPKHFSDEAVAYLVYHELLHHLLPGQGHDAEFRMLEQLWPGAPQLDLEFDTLHEYWDLDPKRYSRDVGGARDVE